MTVTVDGVVLGGPELIRILSPHRNVEAWLVAAPMTLSYAVWVVCVLRRTSLGWAVRVYEGGTLRRAIAALRAAER